MRWFVYIAECKDRSLYTGITTDVKRREIEHNSDNKLGSKYLRSKRPIQIVYSEVYPTQSEARKRENEIKSWKKDNKLKLIKRA